MKLKDLAFYVRERVNTDLIDTNNYVSTENMLPNKNGITIATSIPDVLSVSKFTKNDVLISNIRPYFQKIWFADKDGGCSNDVLVVRVKEDCNPLFLYYLLSNSLFFEYVMSSAKGTKMPRGDRNSIMQYSVPDFSLEIQRKISHILCVLDEKIRVNKQINDNLELQAQALFKSWFVDFEPFQDGEFVDSELGRIPKGWKVRLLGDVTTQIKDRVGNKKANVLSPINSGKLVFSEDYFTKQVYSKDISNYIIVEEHDFAYNPARINIGSIGINDLKTIGCVSPVYVVFRTELEYSSFFNLFIKTSIFKEEVKTRAIGGVRQTLNYSDFSLIITIYPPKEVVCEFNVIYNSILNLIEQNNKENSNLGHIRDTLLPKLMSGEISVEEIEI